MELQPASTPADIGDLCVKEVGQERTVYIQEMHWILIHGVLKSVEKNHL